MRDGAAVTKSKLAIDEKLAPAIGTYLKARATGMSRSRATERAGLKISHDSLNDMEWNALTYAGHTVWNVHNEFHRGSGYRGQSKRKPRADWMIKRDTHEALITDTEAEALLTKLQNNPWKTSGRSTTDYLLTGLLKTPSGSRWFGNGGKHYRTKKKPSKGPGCRCRIWKLRC